MEVGKRTDSGGGGTDRQCESVCVAGGSLTEIGTGECDIEVLLRSSESGQG